MTRLRKSLIVVTISAGPGILFWYGVENCLELSCVGPLAGVVLDVIVVAPLLVIWVRRPRPVPLAMVLGAEAGMAVATLQPEFDFSPQFRLVTVPIGLIIGVAVGLAVSWPSKRRKPTT